MSNKFFKFHFKNDNLNKVASYDMNLSEFTKAMEFAYNKLDELNKKNNGFRIVGVYEILINRNN